MQTTLDIDDELLRVVEQLAAEWSVPVGAAISELIRKGLEATPRARLEVVDGLPLFRLPEGTDPITSDDVRRLAEEFPE